VIELVPAVSRDIKIFVTIVVIVPDCHTHAVANALQTGFFGHVLEGAVRFLAIEAIPVSWARLLGDGAFRGRVLKRSAVDEEKIETPVVVLINEGDTCTHCLRQIVLGRVRGEVIEVDSHGRSDVSKFTRKRLLRIGRGTRLLSRNHCHQRNEKKSPQEKTHT